jgi:hypothetical protein
MNTLNLRMVYLFTVIACEMLFFKFIFKVATKRDTKIVLVFGLSTWKNR